MKAADRIVLVLSGGNALGSFQAGVYEALAAAGLLPDWVIGASAGAINGALIAGNPPERRLERLRAFWRPADGASSFWPELLETARRTAEVNWTIAAGRPGIFGPIGAWRSDPAAATPALFETRQLGETLAALADFALAREGATELTVTAVDFDTGEDVVLHAREPGFGPDHVRASAALPTLFPAIRLDGRTLVDGGLSANLPLDPLFARAFEGTTLCIAVDLLPARSAPPATLGEVVSRMQDVSFAAQSRRSIARWQAAHRLDPRAGAATLARLAYSEQDEEVAGKALDYSAPSVAKRWQAGVREGARLAAALGAGTLEVGRAGLTLWPPVPA